MCLQSPEAFQTRKTSLMKLFPKILTVATSVLLAAGSLAVAPIGANQSASAETIISQLGSDIDGAAANDNSGSSVSLSSDGTRVAIGAPYNDGTSSNAGHVKVYEYSGGTWNQLGSDIEAKPQVTTLAIQYL